METALKNEIATQAAAWFTRLQDPAVTSADRAEFSLWMLRSPEHVSEYLLVMHAWSELQHADAQKFSVETLVQDALADDAAENVRTLPLRDTFAPAVRLPSNASNRFRRRNFLAAAAAIGALVLAAVLFVALRSSSAHLSTAIGEQRSVTLTDGSIVHLNTDSQIRIELSSTRRQLQLLKGEARFTVARDAVRPFVVDTGDAAVRALGTVFNVRKSSDQTAVAVLEGRVEVISLQHRAISDARLTAPSVTPGSLAADAEPRMELRAGQRAAVTKVGAILPDAGPSLQRVTDWAERRLVFREETLASVIEEVNRYHEDHVVISDPALANLRISGSFSASDLPSLIEYLERCHGVHSSRGASGDHILNF